jgi:hypothetical protein
MLGPRLLELNADKKMVRFMRYEALSIWTLSDLEMLANCWEESGRPELIVIDPPSNFLGDIDEHKNAALRGVLMPVVSWLGANRVACIMITHINKQVGKGLDAVGRIMGSVAWASTARVTMAFDKDPQTSGQFLMGASKNNLGPLAGTLAYKIVKTDCLAAIEWIGPVDTDADAMVNQTKTPRRVTAAAFLDEQFRLKRCWASDELIQLARGAGISRNALFEAKGILPIRAKQVVTQDGMRFWEWQAQPEWPEDPPKKAVETLGTLGRCQPKSNDDNTHRTVSMRASDRDTETQFQSPRVSEFQSESTEEEVQRATRQLAGILMSGHVDRDRVVVIASELKVDLWVLNQAADRLGVRRTVEEGKEVWTLP